MLRRHLMVFATMMLLIAGACGSIGTKTRTDAGVSPAAQYVEALLASVDHIEGRLQAIVEVAEQAADRLMAGGRLYAAADEQGFATEAYYRAGGMMMVEYTPADPAEMGDQDVVLVGTLDLKPDEQREQLRAMRKAGARVILFGSEQSPLKDEADFLIGTGLSPGTASVVTVEGRAEPICPAGTVGNITAVWTFTGELVAACTRRGKMPTMYQSILLPGGMDRLKQYEPYAFHEDMEIAPVPPGQLGRAYLAEIRRCLRGMRGHQIPSFQEGGRKMAEVIQSGHKPWVLVIGHHLPYQFGLPGDPGLLDVSLLLKLSNVPPAEMPDQILATIGPEDGLVYVGGYAFPDFGWDERLDNMGVPFVLVTGGRETKPVTPRPGEIYVDPYWEHGDACVEIPGYDIKILPPSGVIQTAALWMISGEVAGHMVSDR